MPINRLTLILIAALALSVSGCGLFPPKPEQLTVTPDQNGTTIHLAVGENFLLKLGEGFNWEITIANPEIMSRVPNITVIRGAQGIFKAIQKGHTTFEAIGEPLCRQDPTPCAIHSILFKVEIEVR